MSTIAMSDGCRVGVQCEGRTLDFVLPVDAAVATLIPSIVDHVAIDAVAARRRDGHGVPVDWQISRIDGTPLSLRTSLRDNGICDGEILWLGRVCPAVAEPDDDVISKMATSLNTAPRWTSTASAGTASVIMVCCTGLVGYALLRAHASPVFAGVLCAVAFAAAVVYGRIQRDSWTAPTIGGCAAACAAVTGYLAVPGDPRPPKLMLAAAVSATVAVLAARYTGRGTTVLTATATLGYLSAAAACAHLFVGAHVQTTGAILGAGAVVMLALTAPLAIRAGRLQVPRLPSASGRIADVIPADAAADARRTHAIVTGLVCGSGVAAVVGAVLAVFGGDARGALFASIVALVLVLRTGTHVSLVQTAALMACGTASFAVVFLWSVGVWPQYANWICLGAVGIMAGAVVVLTAERLVIASPLTRRCVELSEYAALAAVIPAACWVSGVFGIAWGLA